MPTNYSNPDVQKNLRTAEDAGDVTVNVFVFDFANAAYKPAALVSGDTIQIGTIPAGEKLVAHLSRLDLPIIDTNGAPTGTGTVGITGSAADIAASQTLSATAKILVGSSFALATADVGDPNVDTPVYLTLTANVATLATTGKIVFHQVSRPFMNGDPDNGTVG